MDPVYFYAFFGYLLIVIFAVWPVLTSGLIAYRYRKGINKPKLLFAKLSGFSTLIYLVIMFLYTFAFVYVEDKAMEKCWHEDATSGIFCSFAQHVYVFWWMYMLVTSILVLVGYFWRNVRAIKKAI